MNAERWKQIDELFAAVLEIPEPERESFLAQNCAGDEELKNEVLSLLEFQPRPGGAGSGDFLETSAMSVVARNLAREKKTVFGADLAAGTTINTYKIEKSLGEGGMGQIYLAEDEKLRRKIALKILPSEFVSSDERVKRFQLEARAISLLNHPNIVTVFDVGASPEGVNYISTELVEGKNLRQLMHGDSATGEGNSRLKIEEILDIVIQVCGALAAAHKAGIIHRDIKPENVMMRPDGYVKVLDFGLAKLSDDAAVVEIGTETARLRPQLPEDFAKTASGVIVGTPAYMSPDQVTGEKIDYRTDLWSVGVILYELLTGVNPFKKENRKATFQAILDENPPPPASTLNPEISAELDQILIRALRKDAGLGYQTAEDFSADLKRARKAFDSPASTDRAFFSAGRRKSVVKRQRLFWAAGLALLALNFGVLFFVNWQPEKSDPVDWSKATRIPLTDQPGAEIFPTLAPDGKSFVFAAKTNGNYDLFRQRVGDKKARNLTEDSPAGDTQPAFSPNGEQIAFRSEREPSGIYVMSAGGENPRRVLDFGFHPSWSPDGKEIVVSRFGHELPDKRNARPSELWIINVETGEKRLFSKMDAMQPAWSPDGKSIAFWFYPPNVGRRDIAVVSLTGGEPQIITKDGTTNWNPVWSPDGRFLYFASDRGGNMSFWRVAVDAVSGKISGEPEAIVTPAKYSRHLAFSGDGRRMIYVSTDNKSNIQAIEFNPQTEKPIGEPFWITQGDREISRPELSPDGRQFVFRLSRRTQDDIVVANRDGTNPRDLTNDAAFDRYPRWSPDGKRIVFASDRSGVYEIWMINADGTNLRQVTYTQKEGTSLPLWSPDGKRILYRSTPDTFIIDADKDWTQQTPQMIPSRSSGGEGGGSSRRFLAWDWSADGSLLAGSFSGEHLDAGFYSLAENRFEIIAPTDIFPMWLTAGSSGGGQRLIYGFENKIFIADTITKRPREINFRPPEEVQSVGISRDGRLIYYTLHSSESDIWLLDK